MNVPLSRTVSEWLRPFQPFMGWKPSYVFWGPGSHFLLNKKFFIVIGPIVVKTRIRDSGLRMVRRVYLTTVDVYVTQRKILFSDRMLWLKKRKRLFVCFFVVSPVTSPHTTPTNSTLLTTCFISLGERFSMYLYIKIFVYLDGRIVKDSHVCHVIMINLRVTLSYVDILKK